MREELVSRVSEAGPERLESWLGAALAIGRSHLDLSLKDACRDLAGVSDKTLMKWESGDRLQPLVYAVELARRDDVTRRMLIQAIGYDHRGTPSSETPDVRRPAVADLARSLDRASSRKDGERILKMVGAMLDSALGEDGATAPDGLSAP